METAASCFRKVKSFLHVIIQVDVIIAFGGFSALLMDPVRNEFVFQVNCVLEFESDQTFDCFYVAGSLGGKFEQIKRESMSCRELDRGWPNVQQ